eukprot:12917010-Prorocentrum_lima.AAC.1
MAEKWTMRKSHAAGGANAAVRRATNTPQESRAFVWLCLLSSAVPESGGSGACMLVPPCLCGWAPTAAE